MIMAGETFLAGMKSICAYFDRSESTVLMLIRTEGFPARKIGGIWESDTIEIDKWRLNRINIKKTRKN